MYCCVNRERVGGPHKSWTLQIIVNGLIIEVRDHKLILNIVHFTRIEDWHGHLTVVIRYEMNGHRRQSSGQLFWVGRFTSLKVLRFRPAAILLTVKWRCLTHHHYHSIYADGYSIVNYIWMICELNYWTYTNIINVRTRRPLTTETTKLYFVVSQCTILFSDHLPYLSFIPYACAHA